MSCEMIQGKYAGGLGFWRRKSPVTAFLALLLTFTQIQTALADIANTAVATGTYNGLAITPSTPSSAAVPVQVGTATLLVTKTATTPNFSLAGDTVTFDITVENTGTVTAENVAVTDATATTLSCPGGLPIVSLAPGASVTCSASRTIDAADVTAGSYTNTADANASTPSGGAFTPGTDTAIVNRAVADLVTVKTLVSPTATPVVGDTVTYAVTVTNNGPDVATGISLSDALSAGLTATANNGSASGGNYAAPSWTIATLAAGASATLTIEGTVNSGQGRQFDYKHNHSRYRQPNRPGTLW